MQISIGHIDKKLNSTKRRIEDMKNITVSLKEPTTETSPVFLLTLKKEDYTLSASWNYIYYDKWGYYFVDEIVHVTNDLVEFHCHRDALATGVEYLKEMNCYISYCSDTAIAKDHSSMDDPRLGPDVYEGAEYINLGDKDAKTLISEWYVDNAGDGLVALTVLGLNAGPITYFLTLNQYLTVCQEVAASDVSTTDLLASKFFGSDWKSCVVSALYLPLSIEKINEYFETPVDSVLWGTVEIPMSCHASKAPFAVGSRTSRHTIPYVDIIGKKSAHKFLKGVKYTSIYLETPAGIQEISSDAFIDFSQLYMQESINFINGEYTVKLFATDKDRSKGPCVGQATLSISADVIGSTASIPSTVDVALNSMKGAITLGVMGAAIGVAGVGGAVQGAQWAKSYGLGGLGQSVIGTLGVGKSLLAHNGELDHMGTGIAGEFHSAGSGGIMKPISSSGGLTSYFSFNEKKEVNSRSSFRIIVCSHTPALIHGEDVYPPSPAPPTPIDSLNYNSFAGLFGFPCNKYAPLKNIKEGSYIQAVGASIGSIKDEIDHYTLTPREISELNGLLNSGIYLEDWTDNEDE